MLNIIMKQKLGINYWDVLLVGPYESQFKLIPNITCGAHRHFDS